MSFLIRLASRRVPLVRSALRAPSSLRVSGALPLSAGRWLHCSAAPAAAAPARAAAQPAKLTTNITGLDVIPNAREVFIGLQKEILASIEAYNKEHGFEPAYNEQVRKLTQWRLNIAEEEDDVSEIERRIFFGQLEELIEQAENELDLLVSMNEEIKPWLATPEQVAEFEKMRQPLFGQTEEEMRAKDRVPLTEEEKAAEAEFWKEIDAEIAEDQKREAEERAQRKANKQARK